MSTILQTTKVNTPRTLNRRYLNLLMAGVLIVTLAAIFTGMAGSPAAGPMDNSAYMIYRQGEWISVPIHVRSAEAYHLSERTLVDPQAGLPIYLLSERTLIDPRVDVAAYFNSERTSVPVRFNEYQLSEWFGQ